jgi:flavoprotein
MATKKVINNTTTPTRHPQESNSSVCEGKVVSVKGNKLVMTDTEGIEHSHTLTHNSKLTCDGEICKSDSMKTGRKIRVTAKKVDMSFATCVESLDKQTDFIHCE